MHFVPTVKSDTALCFAGTQYQHSAQMHLWCQKDLQSLSDQLPTPPGRVGSPLLDPRLNLLLPLALLPDQRCMARL